MVKNLLRDPATYLIILCVLLSVGAGYAKHYDVMVIWGGWAGFYIYKFFIKER